MEMAAFNRYRRTADDDDTGRRGSIDRRRDIAWLGRRIEEAYNDIQALLREIDDKLERAKRYKITMEKEKRRENSLLFIIALVIAFAVFISTFYILMTYPNIIGLYYVKTPMLKISVRQKDTKISTVYIGSPVNITVQIGFDNYNIPCNDMSLNIIITTPDSNTETRAGVLTKRCLWRVEYIPRKPGKYTIKVYLSGKKIGDTLYITSAMNKTTFIARAKTGLEIKKYTKNVSINKTPVIDVVLYYKNYDGSKIPISGQEIVLKYTFTYNNETISDNLKVTTNNDGIASFKLTKFKDTIKKPGNYTCIIIINYAGNSIYDKASTNETIKIVVRS